VAAIKQCLILAAGNGRRIVTVSGNDPKPLVPVRGTPLVEHALLSAQQASKSSSLSSDIVAMPSAVGLTPADSRFP